MLEKPFISQKKKNERNFVFISIVEEKNVLCFKIFRNITEKKPK